MFLLTLPPELFKPIISFTLPESFESFALTCKTIHSACLPFIPRHNSLKAQYRHFHFIRTEDNEEEDCSSSLQLLARIAEEPIIARYIVLADIFHSLPLETLDKDVAQAQVDQMKEDGGILRFLEESEYLKAAGLDSSEVLEKMFSHHINDDDEEYLAATFLLTLLPNVKQLAMYADWQGYPIEETESESSKILDEIVQRANNPRDPTAGLSKLTDILPFTAWGYDNRRSLATFSPLLSINSVRVFKAGSCIALDDGYTGRPFPSPSFPTFGIGLEEVELVGACVAAKDLRNFLSRTKKLKKLKLNYETKWHGCGHDWDAGATMSMIEDEVGETLEELSFSILNCFGSIETSVAPFMKKFGKLKELELDLRTLLPEVSPITNERKFEEVVIPTLGDMLPMAVEKVCLLVGDIEDPEQSNALACLFSDISREKDEKLPHLKEIVIRRLWIEEEPDQGGDWTFASHTQSLEEELEEDAKNARVSSNTRSNAKRQRVGPHNWKNGLKELGPGMDIKFVKTNGCESARGVVVPEFVCDWCRRYNVSCVD